MQPNNVGAALGHVCPTVAQPRPKLHRTSVDRPEDDNSQMVCIQSDGASEDLPVRKR